MKLPDEQVSAEEGGREKGTNGFRKDSQDERCAMNSTLMESRPYNRKSKTPQSFINYRQLEQ